MSTASDSRPRILLISRSVVRRLNTILLIKRSSNDTHEPQKWECPGGKLEPGQDLTHAQEDEVMQETGLFINPVSRLAYWDSYIVAQGKYIGLPCIVLYGIAFVIGEVEVKLSEEHEDFVWATYEEAFKKDLTLETRKALVALRSQLD